MKVGYIGLGNMGGALAARLALSHETYVFDLDESAVSATVARGAKPCGSVRDLASECDVILLCLPTSAHVRKAIFGVDGLYEHLRPGMLLVDQTTGDPSETRRMLADLALVGVDLIDAPVSGGIKGANAGTIAIMVGASSDRYSRIYPVLSSISPNIFHAGDVGSGQVVKLVNNFMSGTQRLLTLEAVTLAAKNGVDPGTAVEILLAGGARNAYLENYMGEKVLNGNLSPGFTLALLSKDMRLACNLAAESQTPMFFASLAREIVQMHVNELGGNAQVDMSALVLDRIAGTHIVPPDHDPVP